MRARLVVGVLVGLSALCACGGRFGRDRGAVGDEQLGALVELVPKGPSWLVQARPRALAEQASTLSLWRALVTEERERALAERTGIDPLAIEELAGFELPGGYVLLLRGPFDAAAVVARAGERLALRDVVTDRPVVRREGLAGQGRYAYAALAEHTVLVAKEAPPLLIAQILARCRDRSGEGALSGADARSLLAEHATSPLVLFAPKPLALEPGTNVALLFSRERAMAVSIHPTQAVLPVGIDLRGEFPIGAENNFRALAKSLASAQLGRALGLSRVPENMAIRVDQQGAYVTFALVSDELLAGVRMLFLDDLRSLFGS
ncbi:MAG: hypothetical protein JWN48_5663 [Myxococcaceae bacterium]|nr:hypothetical protein [Myxococcaceae bacterium]